MSWCKYSLKCFTLFEISSDKIFCIKPIAFKNRCNLLLSRQLKTEFNKSLPDSFYTYKGLNFSDYLSTCYRTVEQKNFIYMNFSEIQEIVSYIHPKYKAYMIGSSGSKSAEQNGDLDLTIIIPDYFPENEYLLQQSVLYNRKFIHLLSQYLRKYFGLIDYIKAQVPIIRFNLHGKKIQCDVSFDGYYSIKNTHMLKVCYEYNTMARDLSIITKRWAQANGIYGAYQSYPSGYCWSLILLNYLINIRNPPLLYNPLDYIPFSTHCNIQQLVVTTKDIFQETPLKMDNISIEQLFYDFIKYLNDYPINPSHITLRKYNLNKIRGIGESPFIVIDPFINKNVCSHVKFQTYNKIMVATRRTLDFLNQLGIDKKNLDYKHAT